MLKSGLNAEIESMPYSQQESSHLLHILYEEKHHISLLMYLILDTVLYRLLKIKTYTCLVSHIHERKGCIVMWILLNVLYIWNQFNWIDQIKISKKMCFAGYGMRVVSLFAWNHDNWAEALKAWIYGLSDSNIKNPHLTKDRVRTFIKQISNYHHSNGQIDKGLTWQVILAS